MFGEKCKHGNYVAGCIECANEDRGSNSAFSGGLASHDKLRQAIENVIECLLLENMQRPSFTFGRIEKLADEYDKVKNEKAC